MVIRWTGLGTRRSSGRAPQSLGCLFIWPSIWAWVYLLNDLRVHGGANA